MRKKYGRFEETTEYLSNCTVSDLKTSQYHGMCYLKFTIINKKGDKSESQPNPLQEVVSNFQSTRSDVNSHDEGLEFMDSGDRRFKAEERIQQYIIENVVKLEKSLDMNELSHTFVDYLKDENYFKNWVTEKKLLKRFIQDNIKEVLVLRPPEKNKPEVVTSKRVVEKTYFDAASNSIQQCHNQQKEHYKLRDAVDMLRHLFSEDEIWSFEGSFETFQTNEQLHSFFKNLISGDVNSNQVWKDNIVSRDANLLVQIIQFMMKSKRQMKHNGIEFRNSRETPLSVGLALSSHFKNRSRKLVDELHSLHLGISYTKVKQIENDIAASLNKIEDSTGGYVAPLWLRKYEFMCFAIDNIDFNEATCSGKDSLHGTGLCVVQRSSGDSSQKQHRFERQKDSRSSARLPCTFIHCNDPEPKPESFALNLKSFGYYKTSESIDQTRLWMTNYLDTDEESTIMPVLTWSTFNSLCSSQLIPITNIGLISPILRSPPTDYSTLLTELMRAHNINIYYNGQESKTVVGLDMQLFDMAMKLWVSNDDIRKNFYFLAGPLHTVFWALQNIGTYIKDSGIEQVWIESGMYSAKTVDKILAGKQMKRALEAHTTTILALCNIYVVPKIKSNENKQELLQLIEEVKRTSSEVLQSKNEIHFDSSINELKDKFKLLELSALFDSREDESAMQKFVFNYVKQFENILLYIKSIREANINLHLSSLRGLIKYFFAHNNLNYARLLTLQLHIFEKIKTENHDLWKEFENGKFVVTKNNVKFISIGLDHGMEQEIKKLKIKGGIIGITQNMESLDRYFTIAPALSSIVDEFHKIYLPGHNASKNVHHEFNGQKSSRIQSNVKKMRDVFSEFGVGHENIDEPLHNIFTKEVVPENIARDIVCRDELGYNLFKDFVDERLIEGKKTVCDTMHQSKIGTFSSNNATFESKNTTIGKIKEDRSLLQRFIVAARSRTDLDLKTVISKFEFGVVPRALFSSDGSLLLATDTPNLVKYLEKLSKTISRPVVLSQAETKIHVVNGLEILNNMKKDASIINCNDLSRVFISKLATIAAFDEIHLIMQNTSNSSIYTQVQKKNGSSKSRTRFIINDNTVIRNTPIKELLSNNETKTSLLIYLSLKALNHSNSEHNSLKRFCVSYRTITEGNFEIDQRLVSQSHQIAATLAILHGRTMDKSSVATFESFNPDLLFTLIYFSAFLPLRTIFKTGTGKQKREIDVNSVKQAVGSKVDAVLGFHAITGTHRTGKFYGKSKESTFKTFMDNSSTDSLALLGEESVELEDLYEKVTDYICAIYKNPIVSIEETRWFLFSKEYAPEDMPPTKCALKLHLLRAHYITMLWKNALESHPIVPLPQDFGWKSDGDVFKPIMNLDPPAPDTLMQLIKCKCKAGCKTARCSCRKNGLPCTEMCGCTQCENLVDPYLVQSDDEESDCEEEL